MDLAFWKQYGHRVERDFPGERYTATANSRHCIAAKIWHGGNSGAGAMLLAHHFGADKIILLGYDCKYAQDGSRHWHEDYPKHMGNAGSMPKWKAQFMEVSQRLVGVDIINASRDTALDIWPVVSLGDALDGE